MPTRGAYDPPGSGPFAGLGPDQIEDLLLRAVLADLEAGEWDPASISDRGKCEPGEGLRRETGLPLRSTAGFLGTSKSPYEHQRASVVPPLPVPPHGPRPAWMSQLTCRSRSLKAMLDARLGRPYPLPKGARTILQTSSSGTDFRYHPQMVTENFRVWARNFFGFGHGHAAGFLTFRA